ncbi:MAG: Maf family protein [Fimbriimonadaceae bacterium]|nr:Maf family protein [Fimbriimonadaceae bacterium]
MPRRLPPVVLASASPRRQDLLRRLVPEFAVDPPDLDEDALTDPDPWVTAQRLAREKALAVRERHPECLVIAGDTVVAVPSEEGGDGWIQLSKPKDPVDAYTMLRILSGRVHTVITGVCLIGPTGMSSYTEAARVSFRDLTDEEIRTYIASGEPMDKAGSYGLQGGAKTFVERIEGEVETVIGLPLERLSELLHEWK